MVKRNIWHYDLLNMFNQKYYKDVVFASDIQEDEIAILDRETEEYAYFYPLKKNKTAYLLPSEAINDTPLVIKETKKMAFRNKAYNVITGTKTIKIRSEKTKTYKELIDSWLDFEHKEPELFTLWKIIVDTAYNTRLNLRIITYPGWMKDSPVTVLQNIHGNCVTVNKPSLAKLKYLLSAKNKIIGVNEVQGVKGEDKHDLAKFYEDTGDFKPEYVNPKRRTGGASETCDIRNLSTLTFYNFPDEGDNKEDLFDYNFHSKVKSRVFPLLFKGGSNDETACEEKFTHVDSDITESEMGEIISFIRNHLHYNKEHPLGSNKYNRNYSLKNTRWDRNYQAILGRIDLYSENQEEFDKFEKLLYGAYKSYLDYFKTGFQNTLISEEVIQV